MALERRFLEERGLQPSDLAPVIRPASPDDQLEALTHLMNTGRLRRRHHVEALPLFQKWSEMQVDLEGYYSTRFYLGVLLAITLFMAGASALTVSADEVLLLGRFEVVGEIAIGFPPAAVVAMIILITVVISRKERAFQKLLQVLSDKV